MTSIEAAGWLGRGLVVIPVVLCTAWIALGIFSLWVVRSKRRSLPTRSATAVSILKPLMGRDPNLDANLRTFFEQQHVTFELIFGIASIDDPAAAVVESVMAEYPHVNARLVVTGAHKRHNPKVQNLRGMLPYARHDLLLISDSNVRVPPHYASEAIALKTPGVGVVSHLFVGHGDGGLGATLEMVELAGFCSAGVATPTLWGEAALVGKSLLLSRSEFESLGGFCTLEGVLAEDYVMGKMYETKGLSIVLAPTILDNMVGTPSVRTFFERHLRWSMMRLRLNPMAFALEPLTSPLAVAPFAWMSFGPMGCVYLLVLAVLRDLISAVMLGQRRELGRIVLGSIPRELAWLAIFTLTPFKRHVTWRGQRMRLGPGTQLVAATSRARC